MLPSFGQTTSSGSQAGYPFNPVPVAKPAQTDGGTAPVGSPVTPITITRSTQSEPTGAPARYRLHAGDQIQLTFRLSPELNQLVTIDPDGSVSMLVIGRVQLAGLTLPEARQVILSKESQHLVKPEIDIQLTNYQHLYVVVAGEVYLPQRIEMRESMTALQALALAGGVRNTGRETQVLLYRRVNDEIAEVHQLNLKIRKNKQLVDDMPLEPGDLLVVPRSKVEGVARYVRIIGLSYPINPQY